MFPQGKRIREQRVSMRGVRGLEYEVCEYRTDFDALINAAVVEYA